MWQDPIVTETRLLREQYTNQFGHDADAIFQEILRRQTAFGRKLVSFQARKPVSVPVAAQQGAQPDAQTTRAGQLGRSAAAQEGAPELRFEWDWAKAKANDLETLLLTGKITERQRDRKTREVKFVVRDCTIDGRAGETIVKFNPIGALFIITVYLV